jgi:heat-inducible transcriptional repressor
LLADIELPVANETLSERERRVLEAIVQSYVETAEPVGSRTLARRFGLGVSPATIRNAMSDLEEKGYLYHPHTSAGRVPTDRAYRLYVDALMGKPRVTAEERDRLRDELSGGEGTAITGILRRAAEVLGVLTQELGFAVAPSLDEVVLERLDLVAVATDRLLLVLSLRSGVVRTIFVHVPGSLHPNVLAAVTVVLNERLAGCTLREIRQTLPERLRDAGGTPAQAELLDIFLATGEQLFDLPAVDADVLLGHTSVLADQPEFASGAGMRQLIALTEQRDVLRQVLGPRSAAGSVTITIGGEHQTSQFANLTLVTSPYRIGALTGVIGVLGPTRMPYEKVVALVEHTSKLVDDLLR